MADFDWSSVDWGGLLGAGVNAFLAGNNASKNQTAAKNYGNFTQYQPFNLNYGNAIVGFNGNNAYAQLSPAYQTIQSSLMNNAFGYLNNSGGGLPQWLQNEYNQANQNMPQVPQNMGNRFNQTSQGFLNGLGSMDPNQLAGDYTNALRAQAQPGNERAAESLAQRLFNSGALGSTGGANMYGELVNQQNQQDLGFQLAGRQYAGQEQSRLAGLASQFGMQGGQLNDLGFQQGNQRVNQRFQNAMNMFGMGLQNQQAGIQNGLGLLQGAQSLDQNLLQAIGLGGQLGAAKSNANQSAYAPGLEATIAKNNTSAANWANIIGNVAGSGIFDAIGGYFGGGSSGGYGGGYSPSPSVGADYWTAEGAPKSVGSDYWSSGGFNAAGGEAADPSGIGYVTPSVSKVGDGSTGGYNYNFGDIGRGIQSAAGIYTGLDQGGVQGYGRALASGAQLANMLGYGGTGTSAAGALGSAAAGDYIGAARGAYNAATGAGTKAAGSAAGSIGGLSAGQFTGLIGGALSLGKQEGKFAGTASAAMAGWQVYGPIGALIGGIAGYLSEGGFDDANPWDASGFSGLTMDAAWEDQNLARLLSNPVGALASKLGVKSDSFAGKLLDPAGFLSKKGDEKRNMKAFTKEVDVREVDGGYMLPDGKVVNKKQLEKLAGTWYGAVYHPDGHQDEWKQRFQQTLMEIYGS